MPRKLGSVRDPAAPKKGEPRPSRGIGSKAGESTSKPLTWHGHTMSRAAWARYLHISYSTLRYRLSHYPVEQALSPDFREQNIADKVRRGVWPARKRKEPAADTQKPKASRRVK